jgi:potassium inwardly-rectifying channel subfamily J
MSAGDLLKAKLELVVVLEGVVESTGMTTQLRTSFLPAEILWGHRFHDLSSYKSDEGQHVFDFELFNATFPVETPLCSSEELERLRQHETEGTSLNTLNKTPIKRIWTHNEIELSRKSKE